MSVAVVADAHLGGPGGTADLLIEQLRELATSECRHLVLLGDLFHVWVGAEGYETPDIRAIASALGELRAQGFRIDYIEGNRDFFIGSGPYAELFDTVGTEVDFEVGGRRYLAVHGDGLNDRDYSYRFWNWLSKSSASRFFMLNLPDGVARWLVGVTERQLAKTNFKHKSVIPEAVIRDYAESRFAEGFDVLLLGHFHEARQWQVGHGEVQLLEAWFRGRKIERFDDAPE